MHKKFEIIQTKIKGGCQSGRKVVTHNSKNDLPLVKVHINLFFFNTEHIAFTHIHIYYQYYNIRIKNDSSTSLGGSSTKNPKKNGVNI